MEFPGYDEVTASELQALVDSSGLGSATLSTGDVSGSLRLGSSNGYDQLLVEGRDGRYGLAYFIQGDDTSADISDARDANMQSVPHPDGVAGDRYGVTKSYLDSLAAAARLRPDIVAAIEDGHEAIRAGGAGVADTPLQSSCMLAPVVPSQGVASLPPPSPETLKGICEVVDAIDLPSEMAGGSGACLLPQGPMRKRGVGKPNEPWDEESPRVMMAREWLRKHPPRDPTHQTELTLTNPVLVIRGCGWNTREWIELPPRCEQRLSFGSKMPERPAYVFYVDQPDGLPKKCISWAKLKECLAELDNV